MPKINRCCFSSRFIIVLCLGILLSGCQPGNGRGSEKTPSMTPVVSPSLAPTQTSCPLGDQGQPAIFLSQSAGTSQTLLYRRVQGTPGTPKTSSILSYALAAHHETQVARFEDSVIFDAILSADAQWILFLRTLKEKRFAIQIIRVDGQSLQTLYCTPQGSSSESKLISLYSQLAAPFFDGQAGKLYWSPDQKHLVFHYQLALFVLDLATGHLRKILLSPLEQQDVTPDNGGVPIGWLNNTQFAVQGYVYGTDLSLGDVYLIDTNKENQTMAEAQAIEKSGGYLVSTSLDVEGRQIFVSQVLTTNNSGLFAPQDASVIKAFPSQSPKSGRVIYTSPNKQITAIQTVTKNLLLFTVHNSHSNFEENGLWSISTDGSSSQQLLQEDENHDVRLNPNSQPSWSTLSLDGKWFAIEVVPLDKSTGEEGNAHVKIGTLNGGSGQDIASASLDNRLFIIGWTQM